MHPWTDPALPSGIVVHYGEIGTKGGNRQVFEGSLRRNLVSALGSMGGVKVRKKDNRFFVTLDSEHVAEAKSRLLRVFGVAWFAEVESVTLTYAAIRDAAVRALSGVGKETSFRVSVRRPNKSFAMTSQELARKLGEDVIAELGLKVNLSDPGVTLAVDLISNEALVYREHLKGPGGLPVGVTGEVLHLLSGGIDSPVAAWLMMKRGCRPTYLHFYLAPTADAVVQSKIIELVRILSPGGEDSHLILVPFSPYQLATTDLPLEFEPIVFRRFMRMVAERLASGIGFKAISSGDNLAQVASQTLQNMACIDGGSSMTTLRPLLGYDKDEIVQLARQIGTYETSIQEYKDCCSIISRHPRTRMRMEDVDAAASDFAFDELAVRCISMASVATIGEGRVDLHPLEEPGEQSGSQIQGIGPARTS
jgi:tRNA uracil 4-sulfurtransferase